MSEEKKLKRVINSGNHFLINAFFEELYNKYKGLVFYVVSKYISVREDALDIVQDVFISFFNNANNIDNNIKSYLTITAKNKSLNFINKYNKISLVNVNDLDLIVEKDSVIFWDNSLKILKNNLKEIEYKILILHILEDFTFCKISKSINMKESTVKSLYFRTLKKCRCILKEEENEKRK